MLVVSAMWLVTNRASFPERRLVQVRFLELIRLVRMAGKARADRIRLQEAGGLTRMRVMAGNAIALRSRMLNLRLLNLLGLSGVARNAESLRVRVGENDLSILRRSVADFARLVGAPRGRRHLPHR